MTDAAGLLQNPNFATSITTFDFLARTTHTFTALVRSRLLDSLRLARRDDLTEFNVDVEHVRNFL